MAVVFFTVIHDESGTPFVPLVFLPFFMFLGRSYLDPDDDFDAGALFLSGIICFAAGVSIFFMRSCFMEGSVVYGVRHEGAISLLLVSELIYACGTIYYIRLAYLDGK